MIFPIIVPQPIADSLQACTAPYGTMAAVSKGFNHLCMHMMILIINNT